MIPIRTQPVFPMKNTTHYYKFGGAEMFMKEPRPKQAKAKHQNASRWMRQW